MGLGGVFAAIGDWCQLNDAPAGAVLELQGALSSGYPVHAVPPQPLPVELDNIVRCQLHWRLPAASHEGHMTYFMYHT